MQTISSSEFTAHPEMYLAMAQKQDVRIEQGSDIFLLTRTPPFDEQPILRPDEDFYSAITAEELKERMRVSIHKFFADKQ